MAAIGWQRLIPGDDYLRGEGKFRIDAYSEFLPAPWVGWKPYRTLAVNPALFSKEDPWGWRVSEFDESIELQPGLESIGKQVIAKLNRLLDDSPETGIPKLHLDSNPYWTPELNDVCPKLDERCVVLLPLALSRTQDDKGRVRWTLFGNSEQGPSKAFWKSFYHSPTEELPPQRGIDFFCQLLKAAYGEKLTDANALLHAGFRILPEDEPLLEIWNEGKLPSWTAPFVINDHHSVEKVKYLLCFRPFSKMPVPVQKAYLSGKLHLLPFPGSLAFWGVLAYQKMHEHLPFALQIPLVINIARHRIPKGMRVPQSGYLHEPNAERPEPGAHSGMLQNTFKRTHRWDKILRDADELALIGKEDKMIHVLFSTIPDDLSLYDKPMARNVQLWTEDYQILLDGPNASPAQIKRAMRAVEKGGIFGYRFIFPAMRVGRHEVYWHRPLVAYRDRHNKAVVVADAPLGYMTAYDVERPKLNKPIELWPRVDHRALPVASFAAFTDASTETVSPNIRNVRKIVHGYYLMNAQPLPRTLARQMLTLRPSQTLEDWLGSIPKDLADQVHNLIEPKATPLPRRKGAKVPDSLTYRHTARRAFEVAYWKMIADLSEGTFLNKNNADCVRDEATLRTAPYHERQLENLGDHLLAYYGRKIAAGGMKGKVLAGEVPFRWRTDFDYSWMGGWLKNQEGAAERDILVVIPGRDRSRAVIMADHYDTAYMADKYLKEEGGCGARMAACGADDNHSATSAMMLAAPIFMDMSKKGKLACDIWLVHLTGEEFPADCLGARALTQRLVERTLKLHMPGGKVKDLSKVTIEGLYVSDMIAHNNDHERDIFQISPGTGPLSFRLAYHAHMANEIWNESVPEWNKDPERAGRLPGRRSPHGAAIPEIAPFLKLSGEVRPCTDPRSTLYNTDGQIFSDAGVPCVLFMENYDINRKGYHDTQDTMANIDLDYGAALCAITIESVARVAADEGELK